MFAARFRREAKLLAALRHPGIVDIHDYGESDGGGDGRGAYIVMELIEGRSLEDERADRGPLPVADALEIAAQALDALHTAHRRRIVHRDIKPSNLMLRPDGRIVLTDFGIARSLAGGQVHRLARDARDGALHRARAGRGHRRRSRIDMYSLGVVRYELLTGELPFTGASVLEVVLKHIREPARPCPQTSPTPYGPSRPGRWPSSRRTATPMQR